MELEKPLSDSELDELERFLNPDNAPEDRMNVSSLHGFLTALVVSPTFVPPSQWLAEAWGKEEPTFDSDEQAEHFLGLLLRLYDSISIFYGTVARLNQINPFTCLTVARHWPPVSASIGRSGCGMKLVGKLKVHLPGGKWVCWSVQIGKPSGLVLLL